MLLGVSWVVLACSCQLLIYLAFGQIISCSFDLDSPCVVVTSLYFIIMCVFARLDAESSDTHLNIDMCMIL